MTPKTITTQQLYDRIKSLIGKDSAYAVAKFLGATNQTALNWKDGKHSMDDKYGILAAQALDLDPDWVLACLAAERAESQKKPDTAAVWRHIALRLSTAAIVVFSVGIAIFHA